MSLLVENTSLSIGGMAADLTLVRGPATGRVRFAHRVLPHYRIKCWCGMAVAGPGSSETVLSGKVSGLLTLHMFLARRQEGSLQRKPRMCCDVSVSWATSKWKPSTGIFSVFVLGKRCGVACATAVRRKPHRDGGRLWTRHSEGSTQRWSGPTVPGAIERKCNLLTVLVATDDRQRKERGQ